MPPRMFSHILYPVNIIMSTRLGIMPFQNGVIFLLIEKAETFLPPLRLLIKQKSRRPEPYDHHVVFFIQQLQANLKDLLGVAFITTKIAVPSVFYNVSTAHSTTFPVGRNADESKRKIFTVAAFSQCSKSSFISD